MNRTPRGQKPQVEHPFALLARLMHYVFRDYKFHCIAVFLLIFAGVIANVQGTMFTKNLIDDYITPFLLSDNPNFAPLAKAISRVAVFLCNRCHLYLCLQPYHGHDNAGNLEESP